MKHVNKLLLSTLILTTVNLTYAEEKGGFAYANSSKFSSERFVEVGVSTKDTTWMNGIHTPGRAGLGFKNGKQNFLNIGNKKVTDKVDFEGLTGSPRVSNADDAGITVYQMHKPFREDKPWWDLHGDLGSFNFVKVGAGDVWFGEWSQNGNEGSDKFVGHQAFYIGDRKQKTVLPAQGSATYKTYGLNKFTGDNALEGDLTADFGTNELSGRISNGASVVDINATIKSDTASFDGSAKFNGVGGDSQGHFFGSSADSLAGIATFADRKLDTAFGGTKN